MIRAVAALLAVTSLLLAPPAVAAGPHRLVWKDEWPRFRAIEYGVSATLLAELALIEFRAPQPKEANFTGGVLFDDAVRDGLRLHNRGDRATVSSISDFFPLALQAHALFDGLVIPLITDRWNIDVAWQMTMMNVFAMGADGVFNRTGHRFLARERPDAAECRRDRNYKEDCDAGGRFASFPGGHASGAFLGAGMLCAHHVYLPLYGGGVPDVLACALPVAASTATGVMRIMADRHFATDVIAGSVAGFASGFLLPTLLHYGYASLDIGERATVVPSVGLEHAGVAWAGFF